MHHKRYTMIGMGGTFDHLHEGHKHFLRYASDLADTVLVGVTKARLSQHKPFSYAIEDYGDRLHALKQFCGEEHIQVKVVPLVDAYGPTLEKSDVRSLCVTPETQAGADKINELRDKLGLRPLPVYICDYILAENGQPIHSAFIRAGVMNREGVVYRQLLDKNLVLTDSQRQFFSKPQGPVVTEPLPDATFTAVVGDTSLETFIDHNWHYNLGVYDLRTLRQAYTSPALAALRPTTTVDNSAGAITPELTAALAENTDTQLHQVRHILVNGEEDLAAVALVLLLPMGAHVYYGQKDAGIVCLEVTEELKERFRKQLPTS